MMGRRFAGAGFARRSGGRAGGAGQTLIYGANAFTASDQFASADDAGIRGSANSWGAAVWTYETAFAAPNAICGAGGVNATGSWNLWATTGTVYIRYVDSGPTQRSHFVAPGALNTIHATLFTHTSSTLQLWYNGTKIASPIATDGGFTDKVGNPFVVGCRKNSGAFSYPFVSGKVVGCCGGDAAGVPSDAEITAWFNAIKVAGDVVAIGSKTEQLWSVKQDWQNGDATWEEADGGDDLTRNGTPTVSLVTLPWAF